MRPHQAVLRPMVQTGWSETIPHKPCRSYQIAVVEDFALTIRSGLLPSCAGWSHGICEDRRLKVVRQEDQFGMGTVIQFVLKIGWGECLCDGSLRLGLSEGPDPEPFGFTFGPNPNRIALALRPCAGNLGILGRDG